MDEKTCTKCGVAKPLSEFSVDRKRRDGLQCWCRGCGAARRTAMTAARACHSCNGEIEPGTGTKLYCEACAARKTARDAARARQTVAAGICYCCRVKPIDSPGSLCRACFFRRASSVHLGSAALGPQLAALWLKSGGRCALTGVRLRIEPGSRTWDSLSFDHVVPVSKGGARSLENLRLVTWQANQAKGEYSDREFLAMCRAALHVAGELPANDTVDLPGAVVNRAWLGADMRSLPIDAVA